MSKKQLYLWGSLAWIAGCLWAVLNWVMPDRMHTLPVCVFRHVTGIPCPACNSTHSVMRILHLDMAGAFFDNPLGFVLAAGFIAIPALLLYDLARNKSSFYDLYLTTERFVRRPWIAVALVALVTANWMWSIYKFG